MALYYCGQCNTDQETEKWPSGVDKIRAFSPEEIVRCLECGHSVPVDQEPRNTTGDANEYPKSVPECRFPSPSEDSEESNEQDKGSFDYESARESLLKYQRRKEMWRSARNRWNSAFKSMFKFALLLSFLAALVWGLRSVPRLLADLGVISYERETLMTGPSEMSNWLPGETRNCESVPLTTADAAAFHKQIGYALYEIDCGNGPVHKIKITFDGKPFERQYGIVFWHCTRNQGSLLGGGTTFTCKQAGGVLKQSGGSGS